jgi:hypothetical protein
VVGCSALVVSRMFPPEALSAVSVHGQGRRADVRSSSGALRAVGRRA